MNPFRSKKKHPDKKRRSVKKGTNNGDIRFHFKPVNENAEASSSTKKVRRGSPMKEIGNHLQKESPPNSDKTTVEEREFTVNLGDGGKEHVVKGKIQESVFTALRASEDVSAHMDKKKGKKIYLIGKKGIEGCINLGMPLKYVPSDSQFEMKFYKAKQIESPGKLDYRQDGIMGMECILFFVAPNANKWPTNKPLSDEIIRCNELLREHSNLCVFAPEEETIKDALCKDGRFMPLLNEKDWVLMENKKSIPNSHTVKPLSNRTFTIHVKTERRRKSKGPNNDHIPLVPQETQLKTFHYFKHNLLELYPDLKEQSKRINDFFEKQKPVQKKDVFGVYKAVFGKERKNSNTVKMAMLHGYLGQSVGYLEWGTISKEGSATCFVLCDKYILTCHHVIRLIVGEGVLKTEWAQKIGHSARVTFSYIDKHPKENDWFSLEEWFEISDVDLDFAVLKLKEGGNRLPRGLLQNVFVPPFNDLIYIIGHPDGETKHIDGCSVISVFQRQNECTQRLNQGKGAECNNAACGYDEKGVNCIHMYNPRDFPEIFNNPDVVTYDTSFFWGSSGSPVFDRNGRLVAMHTAGYVYGGRYKKKSIIEFGYSVKSILSVIEKKHKSWYDTEIGPVRFAGHNAGENAIGVNPSTNVEMEPVDQCTDVEMEPVDE